MCNEFTVQDGKTFEDIFIKPTNFLNSLPNVISYLFISDKESASKILHPSYYLMDLIKKKYKKGGTCLICNKYISRISKHLKEMHNIVYEDFRKIYAIVKNDLSFYMPKEFKSIENPEEDVDRLKKNDMICYGEKLKGFYYIEDNEITNCPILICAECGQFVCIQKAGLHKKKHKNSKTEICEQCKNRVAKKGMKKHLSVCKIVVDNDD
ncbi:hypothetical protein SteCoe_6644 [Stentor coeruleus]|uniref:Uncharacterized protein n=1 Tax=Stentor coeruleus TaxID=5963 RepID=A0A1R2CPG1_9CILI|nr:hypothetical protein SteCoe_6644 [Stentor coeruleus]